MKLKKQLILPVTKTYPISGNSLQILIVGQGIAGTVLCASALQHNIKIRVIDSGLANSASFVSSGLINPLTGRNLSKSWMIDELLDYARKFYTQLEILLDQSLFQETEIKRKIPGVKEENDWLCLAGTCDYASYFPEQVPQKMDASVFEADSKSLSVKNGLLIYIQKLLESFREYLQKNKLILQEAFQYDELLMEENHSVYHDQTYDFVIFSEGAGALNNPFFNEVTIQANKGQCLILELELPGQIPVVSPGILTPYANKLAYLGSTYERDKTDRKGDVEGKAVLRNIMREMISIDPKILEHKAGIRATTPDRKPHIGRHHTYKNLILFNGLGTKGLSLAPYFANHLFDHILKGTELIPQVNPYRFKNN